MRAPRRRAIGQGMARGAVVPIAAFAVHQLRYLLAFGTGASAELQRQGHSYLHSVAPWLVLGLGLAAGAFLSALGRALSAQTTLPRYGFSLLGLWLTCSVCLIAMYASQEFIEGVFATGHPGGLPGIFGYGGWWAIPAALCVGLVLAALLHGARWLLREVAARHARRFPTALARSVRPARPVDALLPRVAPLALGWCGRGPPG
jgi:hypothetical protein